MQYQLKESASSEKRTTEVKINIICSFVLKCVDAIVYVLIVPITLEYLNPYEYGVWLTLSSILMWINSFDIGLGNGMRNRLATAMANNNTVLGRLYVSTTFFMLVILMGLIIGISSLLSNYANWYEILNIDLSKIPNLDYIIYATFFIFCINFIFKLIGSFYLALQLTSVNNLLVVVSNLLALLIIYYLTKCTVGNLFLVAVVFSGSPLVINILAYLITFGYIFPNLSPSIKYFRLKYVKDLFKISIQFFVIQLSSIILFSVTNLLISHMFGPEEVTTYNISFRYFSVVLMVLNLLLAPMWSATTDAYAKGDIAWIKDKMKKIKKILMFMTCGIIVMILISNMIYHIWIRNEISIPMSISVLMGLYVSILAWSLAYSNFLNGFGKLRLQMINAVSLAILYIPISLLFGKLYGISGILIGMCLLNLSGLILNKIQYNKIIEGEASGIWGR